MLRIRLSPLAQADLDNIWDYTVKRWDADQAAHYLLSLERSMKLLAEHPRVGRSINDIREGYFKFPTASHLLIYRLKPDVIEFIRVLHQAMDVERHI